jgi:hypothetical protein
MISAASLSLPNQSAQVVRRLQATVRFSTDGSATVQRLCPGNKPSRW